RIVIDYQDDGPGFRLCRCWRCPRRRRRLHGLVRDHDREGRALPNLALDPDVATEHGAEMTGGGEALARSAETLGRRGIGLGECLKELGDLPSRHAYSGVFHPEANHLPGLRLRARHIEPYLAVGGELAAVAQQVEQALLH